MKENIEAPVARIGAEVETVVEPEPTAEILGNFKEVAARKRWYNEGPGRLDIG